MELKTTLRRLAPVCGAVLLSSTLSCGDGQTPENEVVRHGQDVVAIGSMPTLADSVTGDAMLAGGQVSFSGAAGGDYLGAGGQQAITGRIHGSLRAAGGEVHVAASVDRNATIFGGDVELDSVGVIARNAYLSGGAVEVNGTVREGLIASGGNVTLNGTVGGDVKIASGALTIGPQARIAGDLRYQVPAGSVHIDRGAKISGKVTALPVSNASGFWWFVGVLGLLLTGAVLIALFPRFAADAAQRLSQNPGQSALVGLGWTCLVPFAIVIAAITVIGIPLAALTAVLYVLLILAGSIPFSIWLGRRLLAARAPTGGRGAIVCYLVGEFVLLVVGIIPFVGGLLVLAAIVFGVGTILLQARATRDGRPAAADAG